MASFNYAGKVSLAEKLIKKYGRDLVFRKAATVADASKPWRGGTVFGSDTAPGVILSYEQKDVDGTLILRGDQRCFTQLPGLDVDPPVYVAVVDTKDNSVWQIVRVGRLQPGPTLVFFDLQLRQ